MEKNSRKDSFDVVKCFAAFFVVQLHTIPATVCPLLNVIARLAVPLFFLITGYYYTSIVDISAADRRARFQRSFCWLLHLLCFIGYTMAVWL